MLHDWRDEVDAKMPYPKTATSKPAKGARVTNTKPSNASGTGSNLAADVATFAPGWNVRDWGGPAMKPGLRTQWDGRKKVLLTHPLSKTVPCVLSRKIEVPTGKKTILELGRHQSPEGQLETGRSGQWKESPQRGRNGIEMATV